MDRLLPAQQSLKAAMKDFGIAVEKMGLTDLTDAERKSIDELVVTSKVILGVRAASSVTLVRIPEATSSKSKAGFVRECKRLIRALEIELPVVVLNAMEKAAVTGADE